LREKPFSTAATSEVPTTAATTEAQLTTTQEVTQSMLQILVENAKHLENRFLSVVIHP